MSSSIQQSSPMERSFWEPARLAASQSRHPSAVSAERRTTKRAQGSGSGTASTWQWEARRWPAPVAHAVAVTA
ncbi:MAG: hypothetical protein KDB86_09475, partial [Actinobacteria bacterium]|nr:hypothetical protein [Actinomycetota bacterium]